MDRDNTAENNFQNYDLTCWYLNIRRVLELIGAEGAAADLSKLDSLSQLGDVSRQIGLLVTLKNRLTVWLHENKPPTLGQLLVENRLKPGVLFTHYDQYFCKGLPQVSAAIDKGRRPPAAEAYAKLDNFAKGLVLSFRFHHEHLTSNSSWSELSGQRRLMVLGAATEVSDGKIDAVPWVMADPLPDLFRPQSMIGNYWSNRLEVHVDGIESFKRIRDVPSVRSRNELNQLRAVPERNIKVAFARMLSENTVPLDWGGEQSDLFSSRVRLDGRRISTAFAFKGPAKFHPMTMADLGKNGDQINRLFAEPAELLILQHCHEITAPVRDTMRAFAQQMGNPRLFCLIDGYDTILLLKAYNQCGFRTGSEEPVK